MAQVRWSLTAGNDLQDIEDFIARDSVLHAITFVDRVIESSETLLKLPGSVEWFQSLIALTFENYSLRSYRIVYLLQDDEACILRVVHGSRDLLALVRREPWEIGG